MAVMNDSVTLPQHHIGRVLMRNCLNQFCQWNFFRGTVSVALIDVERPSLKISNTSLQSWALDARKSWLNTGQPCMYTSSVLEGDLPTCLQFLP